MRRTRLKILPSRCVATLGFTLLLLACPTIAEEVVRPARFSETEASATHAHARIKNVPPEAFEVCKKGDDVPGSVMSPQRLETFRSSAVSSDLNCQANEDHGSLAGKSSSNRIRGDIADNADRRVCDAGRRRAVVGSMDLRRRSMEHRINVLSRRSRAVSEDIRRSRNKPLSVTPIGMREESRCQECDLRGGSYSQSRQLQREKNNGMVSRRIDATYRSTEIKPPGNRYSEERESSRRTRGLPAGMNDRSTLRRDYTSDRRMKEARREIRTLKTLILRETPHEEVRSDVHETIRLSEREARDSRRSGNRASLERRKRSTISFDRLVERRLPVQSREPLTAARSTRNTRSVHNVRSDIRDSYRQSLMQSGDSRSTNTRTVREELSLIRRDTIVSRAVSSGSRGKDKTAADVVSVNDRSVNGRMSIRTVPLSRQRRGQDTFQASTRLSEGLGDRDVRTVLERYSDRRDTLRRSESLELEKRMHRNTRFDQLSDRRLPLLSRDSSTAERASRITRSTTSVRSDARDSSLRRSDFMGVERKIRRTSSVDQISERRSLVAGHESTAAEGTTRRTRSVHSVSHGIRDTSRRSFFRSEDPRRTHVRSVSGETYEPSSIRKDASVFRVEISQSRNYGRNPLVRIPANELSENQRMDIRKNSLTLQRRERDSVQATRRFVDDQRVRNARAVFERNSERRGDLRRSESLTLDRRTRSTSRIDQLSEWRLPGSFHESSSGDRTISRSRSLSSFRSEFRDASRQLQSYSADSRRMHSEAMPEVSSHASNVRRGTRVEISRSRRDEKTSLGRSPVIEISRSISPSLQRRERDSVQAFRRSTEYQRVRGVRAALERYADRKDTLRRSESLGSYRRIVSTSHIDQLSERHSPMLGRDITTAEISARRTRSIPSVRSDIREASRRSFSADSRRASIRSVREDIIQASNVRQDTSITKVDIFGTQSNKKTSLARDGATNISGNWRMDIRTNPLSLKRREHDSAQSSRRFVDDQRARDTRAVLKRNAETRGTLRHSETVGTDRRIRSTSRIDLQHSPVSVREYTKAEISARKIRSISSVRGDVRDISRRSHLSETEPHRENSRSVSEEKSQFSSARRDTRAFRVEINGSRRQEKTTSGYRDIQERSGNERRNIRRQYLLGQRREQVALRASKRFEDVVEARGVRSVLERNYERKTNLRRSESLDVGRRVLSTPQLNQISNRRSAEMEHEFRIALMMTRRARSLSSVRSDTRDASRHTSYYADDLRRTQSRSVPVERYQASSVERDARVTKVGVSHTRGNERTSLVRGKAIEFPRRQRMNIRINTLSLQRRERDSAPDSRRSTEEERVRDVRAVFERNSDRRNSLWRSESLRSDGRIGSTSRISQLSERRLPVLGRDSTIAERNTRKTRSIPRVRSDILDTSRRSRSVDSRRTNARSVLEDSYLAPSSGRDTGVSRFDISRSRAGERISLAATEISSNRRLDIQTKPSSLYRREHGSAQASRRFVKEQMARNAGATFERYADQRETLSRSESLGSDKKIRSISRIDQLSERRLPVLGRESTTTERHVKITRSFPSIRSSIRQFSRRSSLYSAGSHWTFSRFSADDLSQVTGETRVFRVEKSRSGGDDRTSLNRIQALEVSRNKQMNARSNTLSPQRQERDSTLASRRFTDDQMIRDVRSTFGRYSDKRDALRRSETLGPDRRIRRTSRINQLSARHSLVIGRESATAERIAGRSWSGSSVRSDIRDITRWAIRDSVDSRIKDSRSRIMQPLSVRVREDELRSTIFRSRSKRGNMASRDRSQEKIRATIAKHEIMAVESIIRRVSPHTGVKFDRRDVSRLSEWKSGDPLRIYSPFEQREESNGPTFRRDAQGLRFKVTIPRTGEYENGKKLTGARRLSVRSKTVLQRRARDVSRESVLRIRDSTLERVDRSYAPSYRRDQRESRITETARNTVREVGIWNADESIVDNRRTVLFRHKSTPAERRVHEAHRVTRRVPDKSGAQKMKYLHLSGRSEVRAVIRPIQVIQQTINHVSNSIESQGNLKSLGFVLDPVLSSSGKLSENYQLVNHVMKYFSAEKMASQIPAIQSMATSAAALSSIYLPDWNFNAIMFSNEFVPLDNGYKPISSGNLSTDYPAMAASSLRTLFLPQVYSNGNKVVEGDIKNMKSVARGSHNENEINGKTRALMQGPSDEPSFNRMLYPKMTNDDGLFSMTIGGCIAALAMSVSTK